MRAAVALFATCVCVTSLSAADAPKLPADEQVRFDGAVLGLAFEGEDPGATIKEYLPAGEKLESWTKLAAIRQFQDLNDPVAYAEATIKQLKQDYPQSPSAVVKDPNTGAVILDFVVWPEDASFVEFNVFRYEKRPGGGLTSQQYALRAYGDQAEPFLKGLRDVRERIVKQMSSDGLQIEANTAARELAP